MAQNYTLGRGKLYFAPLGASKYEYIGNTPEFNVTIENETLDHFSDDEGVREKDDSVDLGSNRSGSFVTDNIKKENIARFFFGTSEELVVAASGPFTEPDITVNPGDAVQIGVTASAPNGVQGTTGVSVTGDAGAPVYVLDTDYTVDNDAGVVHILETGGIAAGTIIEITYSIGAHTRDHVESGTTPIDGKLMFIAANPKGKDFDYRMNKVKIAPNGDFAMKGQDWQRMPFSLEILKPDVGAAIEVDGKPAFT